MYTVVFGVLITCLSPHTVDGDTLRCSNTPPVRVVAEDTPDHTWSYPCRRHIGNHICDDQAAIQAAETLDAYIQGKRVTIRPLRYDQYRRIVAQVFVNRHDLSCYMLSTKQARYIKSYDTGKLIARRCPRTVRNAIHG